MYPIHDIIQEIGNIETITDPHQLTKLSQDYYTFSPVLQPLLRDKRADLVVKPSNETEVIRVAASCVKNKTPLTIRGAGTGNYGQCVPLHGGVVLDLTKMQTIYSIQPGLAIVDPGVKLAALDKESREIGWEIRMAPSTYRTATIGGFIGGGSGGIGSITYGQLRDRGNLHAVRVVTMEDNPRVLELRGDEVQKVNHGYGVNGIITQLEIPLGPAYPWAEIIVAFSDFMTAARFGQELGLSDGIIKKLISICAWPIPSYFTSIKDMIPQSSHIALLMIAQTSIEPLFELVKHYQGDVVYQKSAIEAKSGISLAEFSWNHTTLHARNVDSNLTYLQILFPDLALMEQMYHDYQDELIMHLEFIRSNGTCQCAALPLIKYQSPDRINEIIAHHEQEGAISFNPHTYILEDGGMKTVDPVQVEFKKLVDPYGLLNPGKMKGWIE